MLLSIKRKEEIEKEDKNPMTKKRRKRLDITISC